MDSQSTLGTPCAHVIARLFVVVILFVVKGVVTWWDDGLGSSIAFVHLQDSQFNPEFTMLLLNLYRFPTRFLDSQLAKLNCPFV